jgi:hypothetical protein
MMTTSKEPVAYAAIVRTGLLMLMTFGVELSAEQIAAVMAFVEALLFVAVRNRVTPVE